MATVLPWDFLWWLVNSIAHLTWKSICLSSTFTFVFAISSVVGTRVGCLVGLCEGARVVGAAVTRRVGADDGDIVGEGERCRVGEAVGSFVGAFVFGTSL